YAANQYSKAFIIVREAEAYNTDLALLCSSFIKKDFSSVHSLLNKILLATFFDENDSVHEETEKQQVYIFAKSISNLMDYLYTGNQNSLNKAVEILDDLLELLMIETEPSMWWVVRIFKIISEGFSLSSLWPNISSRFGNRKNRVVTDYINNLIFGKKPITELFPSQRRALPLVFKDKGAVISLPTSSGKTQIAALGILQSLIDNPSGKILYLAPYRSLAFEVENTLKEIFEPLNYEVSQLYGTGQFSKLDKLVIEDTNILIATPEKAKVILRANQEIAAEIKLIVIDEGHLLDESKRNVINELFVEELKVYISRNTGKIILLSAVLPNTEDISKWICDDETLFVAGEEKLARQRLGVLDFQSTKNTVNLEWYGEEASFNPNFIRPIPPTGRKKLVQPKDIKDAVALTALKLSDKKKTVLIFTARAVSAPTYSKAVVSAIKSLDLTSSKHKWNDHKAYEEFKLLCSEYKSKENQDLLTFAEYGILCHYGSLNRDIRLAMEKLMKSSNPRIIVATMTLGQGVNLGVSTVILADTAYYDNQKKKQVDLTTNEVWNIIGRAGRAFQDIEGKILFATETSSAKKKAIKYIDGKPQNAYSGLLKQIKRIKDIAEECNIDFEALIELISNNDLTPFKSKKFINSGVNVKKEFEDIFDWIDDALLSLNIQNEDESIDDNLRQTLAYIQAEEYRGINQEDVIQFLEARNSALKNIIVPDR
ncbi:MAG: DEAD/DEAH box helicase, partial [Chryseobacterium sp.]|nr:DEAD/DEAH box helicase [Chryseobacterium sp.]